MKYHRIGKNGGKVEGKKSAGIMFTDGRSILLLKRTGDCPHSGTWGIPGGKARDGETEIGNAIRETREELGVTDFPGYRFDSFVSHDGRKKFTTFLYRVASVFQDISLSEEHSDWGWVAFDKIGDLNLHPKLEENLPRYLKAIRRKVTSFAEWRHITENLNRLT